MHVCPHWTKSATCMWRCSPQIPEGSSILIPSVWIMCTACISETKTRENCQQRPVFPKHPVSAAPDGQRKKQKKKKKKNPVWKERTTKQKINRVFWRSRCIWFRLTRFPTGALLGGWSIAAPATTGNVTRAAPNGQYNTFTHCRKNARVTFHHKQMCSSEKQSVVPWAPDPDSFQIKLCNFKLGFCGCWNDPLSKNLEPCRA